MKRKVSSLLILLLITSSILPACSSPGTGKCEGGLCVDLELTEPIRMNEPVPVTITVESREEDKQGLKVSLWFSAPDVQVDGESEWVVDLKARTSIQFSTTIRFPAREGHFLVYAGALDYQYGRMIIDSVPVQLTLMGGTLNPSPEREFGTPAPLERLEVTPAFLTPSPPLSTPVSTPSFEERPTPWDRSLPRLPPDEILARCGWSLGSASPVLWEDVKVWVEIPEQVSLNTLVHVVVGLEVGTTQRQERLQKAQLALCLDESGVVVEGVREWSVVVQPGTWITVTATLQFTQAGAFAVRAAAYDPATGRVTEGGQRIMVNQDQEARGLQTQSIGWVKVITQTFEGVFPSVGWTVHDLSDDGYTRYWDDDDYRFRLGNWAAWPARGGTHGRNPVAGNDDYFNNMNTRMIYGPFDLSDAVMADVWFYLWREIEANYDYLAFEISRDGVAFQELARWSDVNTTWTLQDVDFNEYVGDNSVWVAWRFSSDGSVTKDGPWVDDITIWKYVPGQVTAYGTFSYYDRNSQLSPARYTRVYLYDADPSGGDDLLGLGTTDENGFWQIGPITNWDTDASGALDLYAVFETDVNDSNTTRRRVTNFGGWAYKWQIPTKDNVASGNVDLGNWAIGMGNDWEAAMWIFQDMRRAWKYIHDNTGTDPGSATVRWEKDKTTFLPCTGSCAWPYTPISGIFIDRDGQQSPDVIIHELGHQYMYNASGSWWWPNVGDMLECLSHGIQGQENPLCAWTEGWADFLPLVVNGDRCFDWNNTSCSGLNLEMPTWGTAGWDNGDEVEGRVAGALYDIFDEANDGLNQIAFGFTPIWTIVRTAPHEQNFAGFWSSWRAQGYNQHSAVQAIYQNTIDYDTPPTIANLPDRTVLQNFSWNNAIDLWVYSSDLESSDWELDWLITNTSDWRCQVTIDAQDYVDITPLPSWLGSCVVTIRVSDGIKFSHDTFTVRVVPVVGRVFLPLVMRNYGGGGAMAVPGETTFMSPLATPDTRPRPFESPLPMPEVEPGTFRSPLPTPVGP